MGLPPAAMDGSDDKPHSKFPSSISGEENSAKAPAKYRRCWQYLPPKYPRMSIIDLHIVSYYYFFFKVKGCTGNLFNGRYLLVAARHWAGLSTNFAEQDIWRNTAVMIRTVPISLQFVSSTLVNLNFVSVDMKSDPASYRSLPRLY